MFERRGGEPIPLARLMTSGLALLSLAAGAIHLSAASQHREHRLIFAFFIGAAVVQLAWAGLVVQRPSRRLLLAGALVNAAIVAVWIVSRTSGLPLVAGARAPEELGFKDTVCALVELLLVAGVGLLAVMPDAASRARVPAQTAMRGITAMGLGLLLLAVPAAVSSHGHGEAGHIHSDAELAAAGVDPELLPHTHNPKKSTTATAPANEHDHEHADEPASGGATASATSHDPSHPTAGHSHAAVPTAPDPDPEAGHSHVDGPAPGGPSSHVHASGSCTPTPVQQAAADRFAAATKAALKRWTDQSQALADGYVPFPPIPADWTQHYVNFSKLDDGRTMDPANPESLLYAMTDEGYRPISALYILPHADSPIPDTFGCLAEWHGHEELFLRRPGEEASPPMLHVFSVPMPGGAFAHEADPQTVRAMWMPFRVLINPWYKDGCAGAPWLPGDPYQAIPSCRGGHTGQH